MTPKTSANAARQKKLKRFVKFVPPQRKRAARRRSAGPVLNEPTTIELATNGLGLSPRTKARGPSASCCRGSGRQPALRRGRLVGDTHAVVVREMAAEIAGNAEDDDAQSGERISQHRRRPVVSYEERDDEQRDDDQVEDQMRRRRLLGGIRHRGRDVVDEPEHRGEQCSDDTEADQHDAERGPYRRVDERGDDVADERAHEETDRERYENRMDRMTE